MTIPVRPLVLSLLFASLPVGSASAGAVCDRLSFELANLASLSTPGAEARKFARAIVDQKRSLRELARTSRAAGCSSGSLRVVGGANAGECEAFAAKQARMERNLEILEHKRIALLSRQSTGAERRRLVAALDANGCNEQPLVVSTAADDADALVQSPDDAMETIRIPSDGADYRDSRFVDLGGASVSGSFRTMCVRTCDGAYFPISSHASTLSFRRDAQVCSMMCPGTETELYYHSIQQESDAMRSTRTGRPYEEMDNAFRFRTRPLDRSQCGCNFSVYYSEMMRREAYISNPDKQPVRQSSIVWLKPVLRGGLEKPVQTAVIRPAAVERSYVPDDKVRVIGPKFLPDNGIDFTRPVPDATE
jgi:hypothetical protein